MIWCARTTTNNILYKIICGLNIIGLNMLLLTLLFVIIIITNNNVILAHLVVYLK